MLHQMERSSDYCESRCTRLACTYCEHDTPADVDQDGEPYEACPTCKQIDCVCIPVTSARYQETDHCAKCQRTSCERCAWGGPASGDETDFACAEADAALHSEKED